DTEQARGPPHRDGDLPPRSPHRLEQQKAAEGREEPVAEVLAPGPRPEELDAVPAVVPPLQPGTPSEREPLVHHESRERNDAEVHRGTSTILKTIINFSTSPALSCQGRIVPVAAQPGAGIDAKSRW